MVAASLAALAAGGGVAGSAPSAQAPETPATYADPSGDGNGAPDITSVTIAQARSSETIDISVTATGLGAIDPAEKADVNVFLDTDDNAATGSFSGCEFWLQATGDQWFVHAWDAGRWTSSALRETTDFTRTDRTLTWAFPRATVGSAAGFRFTASAAVYDEGGHVVGLDFAPDQGDSAYSFVPTPVRPVIAVSRLGTTRAIAGRRMALQFLVTLAETGEPLAAAGMTAQPTVDGSVLGHVESFRRGVATVSFVVPRRLRGRILRVRITITATGGSATKTASFRIR